MRVPSRFIVQVDDYHYFDTIQSLLADLTGKAWEYIELDHEAYHAVFYVGRKPRLIYREDEAGKYQTTVFETKSIKFE